MRFHAFPVIRYLLYFIAGILAYFQTNYFHTTFYYFFAGLLLTLIISIYTRKPLLRGITACLLFMVSGWIISYQRTGVNNPEHFTNQKLFSYYQAVITANAEIKPKTYKVEAVIRQVKTNGKWQKATGKVLLYFNRSDAQRPRYGDIFLIKNRPEGISPPKNPEEFNYQQFLHNKGIYAQHFLREKQYFQVGNLPPSILLKIAYKANLYADSIFRSYLKTTNEYAITNAMVTGIRDDIDNDLLSAYSASGAIHVLSVSGMHVGILLLFLRLTLSRIRNNVKYGNWIFTIVALTVLWVYAIFTGLSSTVLRASVMFSFILLGTTINRQQNIYNIIALSALLLLFYNPYWLTDIGFQLSYMAVIGIVYLHPYLNQLINPTNPVIRNLWEGSVICFAAQLFTTPLSIYYFHQFPSYFLLVNPFVTLFSCSILPAGLLLLLFSWAPVVANVLAFILKYSCILLNTTIFTIERMPVSTLTGFSISIPELLAWYGIILLVILFFVRSELRYLRLATLGIICLTIINIDEDYRQSRQKQLTFHFIPKQSGISIINGKSVTLIADSSITHSKKNYDLYFKNYYNKQGITHRNLLNKTSYANKEGVVYLEFEKQKIVWLQKPFRGALHGQAQYVLLSNNAIGNLATSFHSFKPNLIIVDDSNKKYLIDKLKQQADSLHINLIALQNTGAYSITTN